MNEISHIFVSWQSILSAFVVFALIKLVRKVGTKTSEDGKKSGFAENKWFKMFLPVFPYVLSSALVFIPDFPLPTEVKATLTVKIMFAVYIGWLSDKAFQIVKQVLKKGFNV
jgi:hypothetical protein